MPSPFPGMNPYLEQDDAWHDFHERFIPLIAERLGAQLVPDYIVKIDEHIYVHELTAEDRRLLGRADVALTPSAFTDTAADAVGVMDAPTRVRLPAVDVERLAFIEIRDRHSRELVTVIELLSPSNKRPGPDREQYLGKRGQLLASAVHLVEIDFLRGGEPMPIADRPRCDYSVLVSHATDRPVAAFWPIHLREPLPAVPIPVRPPHAGARLDLQEAFHHVFDAAGYEYYIYEGRPSPPLGSEDAQWAAQLVPPSR